jgi:hypothetical protein
VEIPEGSGKDKTGIKSLSITTRISKRNRIPISPPIGKYLNLFSFTSVTLIFNIITTKRKRTAIAPTYTTKKIIAKKSKFNKINNPAALQKTRIKNKTE